MSPHDRDPGGVSCREVSELLELFSDGVFSAVAAWRVAQHLRACEGCRYVHEGTSPVEALHELRDVLEAQRERRPSAKGDHRLEQLLQSARRRFLVTALAVVMIVALAFGSVGYVTGRWDSGEELEHYSVAWTHDAFVELQVTEPMGSQSVTVRRALFDATQTVIFMTTYDADGEPFRLLEPFDVRLRDPQGGSYDYLGAGSGFVVFGPVNDDVEQVTLDIQSPQGHATRFSIPVKKVDTAALPEFPGSNLLQQAGPYGFTLDRMEAENRQTTVTLDLQNAPQGQTVDDFVGYMLGIVGRTPATRWPYLRTSPGHEPLRLEPAPVLPPVPEWAPPSGPQEAAADHDTHQSWRAPVLAMAVTDQGDTWLQYHDASGSGNELTATLAPLPQETRWLRIEIPNVLLFRQFDRGLQLDIPADYAEDLPGQDGYSGGGDDPVVSIPIHGRFAYDGLYIILEKLEIWAHRLLLRYRVETPSGRAITDDYPLLVTVQQADRIWASSQHSGFPGARRGVWITAYPGIGPMELTIHAVGENHCPVYWLLHLQP